MSRAARNDPPQPAERDYSHAIIAPPDVVLAIEAANTFEVLGAETATLSLSWDAYRALPEVKGGCGYPPKGISPGYCWRVQNREVLSVGHVLEVNQDGTVRSIEWFDVVLTDR